MAGKIAQFRVSEKLSACEDNEGFSIAKSKADEQSSEFCSQPERAIFPVIGTRD